MISLACPFEPPHMHEFPNDWEFSGANGRDPRGDQRWRGDTYIYLDDHLNSIWTTQTPLCDEQAIDEFTKHASIGATYLQVKRAGQRDIVLLDWQYDRRSDTAFPLGA